MNGAKAFPEIVIGCRWGTLHHSSQVQILVVLTTGFSFPARSARTPDPWLGGLRKGVVDTVCTEPFPVHFCCVMCSSLCLSSPQLYSVVFRSSQWFRVQWSRSACTRALRARVGALRPLRTYHNSSVEGALGGT